MRIKPDRLWLLVALAGCVMPPGRGGGADDPSSGTAPPDATWMGDVSLPEGWPALEGADRRTVAAALRDVASEDFDVYAAAARTLVRMGEPVVPYLGHAAARATHAVRDEGLFAIVLTPILEALPATRLPLHLASPYALVRSTAATAVGKRHLTEHAGLLVGLLTDADEEVRRSAVVALRMMTNRFFGYRPDGPPAMRDAAAARWRELWGTG